MCRTMLLSMKKRLVIIYQSTLKKKEREIGLNSLVKYLTFHTVLCSYKEAELLLQIVNYTGGAIVKGDVGPEIHHCSLSTTTCLPFVTVSRSRQTHSPS